MRWVMRLVSGDCSGSNGVEAYLELIDVVEHVLAME